MYSVSVVFTNRYNNSYNNNTYDYIIEDDMVVGVDDLVIVHNGSEYAIAKVVKVNSVVTEKANKTIVKLVTVADCKAYQEKTTALAQEVRERKNALARLEQLLAAEDKNIRYRMLAERSEEAKKLLELAGIK